MHDSDKLNSAGGMEQSSFAPAAPPGTNRLGRKRARAAGGTDSHSGFVFLRSAMELGSIFH